MERLFLIGQYQLHLIKYKIHIRYPSYIPYVWQPYTKCMVCSLLPVYLYSSLFTPHVVLPKWGNRSTFAPRKANRASQSMWLTAISPHRNASLSLLGIPHILVAINKMDLVDFSKDVYDKIVADYKKM